MVSDFRKKKLIHFYNAFLDVNKSGNLDKADFDAVLEKAAKVRGWEKSNPKYVKAQETLEKVWNALQKRADADNDGQVSADEWVAMCDEYANKPDGEEWQSLYAKYIFILQDASDDGSIDSNEYSTVLSGFGLDKEECKKAFQKMSKGKDQVTWDDFQALWKEYFLSEDVNAAGNFIFGKTSF